MRWTKRSLSSMDGSTHRRGLEAVAQGLVVELHRALDVGPVATHRVPVVDQMVAVHGFALGGLATSLHLRGGLGRGASAPVAPGGRALFEECHDSLGRIRSGHEVLEVEGFQLGKAVLHHAIQVPPRGLAGPAQR